MLGLHRNRRHLCDYIEVMAGKRVALRYEQHINVPTSCFGAVENGVTLVRATRWGLSAVVDACGRELAYLDHFAASERVLIAEAPVAARRTLYARIGDAWAWLCMAGLMGITVWAILLAP